MKNEPWINMIIRLAPTPKEARDCLDYDCGTRYIQSTIDVAWNREHPNGYDEEFRSKWNYFKKLLEE